MLLRVVLTSITLSMWSISTSQTIPKTMFIALDGKKFVVWHLMIMFLELAVETRKELHTRFSLQPTARKLVTWSRFSKKQTRKFQMTFVIWPTVETQILLVEIDALEAVAVHQWTTVQEAFTEFYWLLLCVHIIVVLWIKQFYYDLLTYSFEIVVPKCSTNFLTQNRTQQWTEPVICILLRLDLFGVKKWTKLWVMILNNQTEQIINFWVSTCISEKMVLEMEWYKMLRRNLGMYFVVMA